MPEMMVDNVIYSSVRKIVFVSNSCWSIYNFRIDVLLYFIQQGYEVHVIAPKDDFATELLHTGCTVHHIAFNNRKMSIVADIQLFLQLKKLYRKIEPDIIFSYVIKPNIYGSFAAAALGIPHIPVITGLGYVFARKNWLLKLVKLLYKTGMRKAKEVWFLNSDDLQLFIAMGIIPAVKARLLQSEGVNTHRFVPPVLRKAHEPFVFLILTRMLWTKGLGVLAEAIIIIKKKYAVECRLMGFFEPNHPDSIPLNQFQLWRNEGIFAYHGFTKDVLPALQEADCFVLPTYYPEGVPRSLLEACAVGLPVITTDHTGCKDVVEDGVNGLLCPLHDAVKLAEKMEIILLMSVEERTKMGEAGRAMVKANFDMQLVIKQYEQVIQHIVA